LTLISHYLYEALQFLKILSQKSFQKFTTITWH